MTTIYGLLAGPRRREGPEVSTTQSLDRLKGHHLGVPTQYSPIFSVCHTKSFTETGHTLTEVCRYPPLPPSLLLSPSLPILTLTPPRPRILRPEETRPPRPNTNQTPPLYGECHHGQWGPRSPKAREPPQPPRRLDNGRVRGRTILHT